MLGDEHQSKLERALSDHWNATDLAIQAFQKSLLESPVPETIYHYTDDIGLRGILESGRLWFTDLFNLNDPSELAHGINHAIEILKIAANQGLEAKQFADQFANTLGPNVTNIANYFVCCFSENGDDLGQWRAYADDGRGYAIGFETRPLKKAFETSGNAESEARASFPVRYDDGKLREMHAEFVATTIPAISTPTELKVDRAEIEKYWRRLSINLAMQCARASVFFKHGAYCNEEEYRFLQLFQAGKPVPDLKLRSRPYSLVKYREYDWKELAADSLKEIVIGPSSQPEVGRKFAKECLQLYLPMKSDISITQSRIPYRSARR